MTSNETRNNLVKTSRFLAVGGAIYGVTTIPAIASHGTAVDIAAGVAVALVVEALYAGAAKLSAHGGGRPLSQQAAMSGRTDE
jgi:hypothetical protein